MEAVCFLKKIKVLCIYDIIHYNYKKGKILQNYNFLKPSNKLEIIIGEKSYYCTIYYVEDDIVTVIADENITLTEQNADINIFAEDGVYNAISRIVSVNELNGQLFYRLSFPVEIKYSQRREFLRANIETDFILSIKFDGEEIERIETKSKNLCAKGLCFIADKPLRTYTEIDLTLFLQEKQITTKCEVVYSNPVRINNTFKYLTAVTFLDITQEEMNFITLQCMKFRS